MRAPRPTLLLGFTLVELMVMIAVMVVPMAVAAPSFADFFDRNRLRGAGQCVAIEVGGYPDIRVSADPFTFAFDSNLGAVNPLGSDQITLTSPSGKYDLAAEVNSLGQARICVPAGKPVVSGIASC